MKTTLKKFGENDALILDTQTMERMGLTSGAEVNVAVYGKTMIIEPATQTDDEALFKKAHEHVLRRFDGAFRRLAE